MRALLLLIPLLAVAGEWSPQRNAIAEVDPLYLHDEARDRTLSFKVYHPDGPGPFPVVVFSHGLGGSQWGYEYLGRAWAAAGLISIHPSHPGSDWRLVDGKGPFAKLDALKGAMREPDNYRQRPRDVSFLIDRLDAIGAKVPVLVGRIDGKRVGVAGHSFGAWTTMAVAGMRVDLPGEPQAALADPRPLAFIALSPNGTGAMSASGAWAAIRRPLLAITGSADEQPKILTGEFKDAAWRMEAWHGLPAGGNKLLLWIEEANHTTFSAGKGGMGAPCDPRHLEAVALVTAAWWRWQLAGDEAARAWLDGGGPEGRWPGMLRTERK